MEPRKNNTGRQEGEEGRHEHRLPQEISPQERELTSAAHEEAERDMDEDPELSAHSPNDDLDEGETARLGEDETPII